MGLNKLIHDTGTNRLIDAVNRADDAAQARKMGSDAAEVGVTIHQQPNLPATGPRSADGNGASCPLSPGKRQRRRSGAANGLSGAGGELRRQGNAPKAGRSFGYDMLVLSVGALSNNFGIPGMRKNCLMLVVYLSRHKSHPLALHGWWRTALMWLAQLLGRTVDPSIKRHG